MTVSDTRFGQRPDVVVEIPVRKRSREAVVMKYYHVIKRTNAWEVYANDGTAALASDPLQAGAIKKARMLARNNPGKVVLHTACDEPIE